MKKTNGLFIVLLLISLIVLPSVTLAEDGFEQGNGWEYQNGSLRITENYGFTDFFSYDQSHNNKGNHPIGEDVTCLIIGKNVTVFNMFSFGAPFFPTQTIVEDGNSYFTVVNGWLINTKTQTLICAADLNNFQYIERVENIPSNVQYIGQYAFYPLNCIEYILLPDSVIGIEDWAFSGCQALERIDLSSNLRKVAAHAFDYCTSLQKLSASNNLEKIGIGAFSSCYWLEKVQIENSYIETIEASTFQLCVEMRFIVLPEMLEKVEREAFLHCTKLEAVIIKSSHVVIEDSAFAECENLQKIVFQQSPPQLLGSSLFGEDERTPDGKSFIMRRYDPNGKVIPYPTLYYTAAYAAEWAPNGETEWNGYPIQQISQEELDAILAEARGEEAPAVSASPVPTETPQIETPVPEVSISKPASDMGIGTILLVTVGLMAIVVVVIAILRSRKEKK